MISPLGALERLRDGNHRFVSGARSPESSSSGQRSEELAAGQEPFAIVLGCADSRVPPELIFDQAPGDLFVIRVAGNIVAPPQLGSIEFAVEGLGTRLAVVLGHSMCGAILATLEELDHPAEDRSPNLGSIIDRIRPSVEPLRRTELRHDRDALVREAVRANVRASVNQIREGSPILERRMEAGELLVLGAEYSLETGAVDFFEGMSQN